MWPRRSSSTPTTQRLGNFRRPESVRERASRCALPCRGQPTLRRLRRRTPLPNVLLEGASGASSSGPRRREVFAHVDRAGHGVAAKRAGEAERQVVAAPQLRRFPFLAWFESRLRSHFVQASQRFTAVWLRCNRLRDTPDGRDNANRRFSSESACFRRVNEFGFPRLCPFLALRQHPCSGNNVEWRVRLQTTI